MLLPLIAECIDCGREVDHLPADGLCYSCAFELADLGSDDLDDADENDFHYIDAVADDDDDLPIGEEDDYADDEDDLDDEEFEDDDDDDEDDFEEDLEDLLEEKADLFRRLADD